MFNHALFVIQKDRATRNREVNPFVVTMVEVAVIGAGAAGLVASRHLLGSGLRPFIFETAKTVGGECYWT